MISAFQNLSKFENRTNFGKAGNPNNSIEIQFKIQDLRLYYSTANHISYNLPKKPARNSAVGRAGESSRHIRRSSTCHMSCC